MTSLLEHIQESQGTDEWLVQLRLKVEAGEDSKFRLRGDGILEFRDRVCVPRNQEPRRAIMEEAHSLADVVHSLSIKMYRTIKSSY